MNIGDKLNNGAIVLQISKEYVLALWGNEFVTWGYNDLGDAFWGHYHFQDLGAALAAFNERSA